MAVGIARGVALRSPVTKVEARLEPLRHGGAASTRKLRAGADRSLARPDRLQEIEHRGRCLIVLNVASAHFISDLDGRVATPSFGGVEDDDPDRMGVLARQQVADQLDSANPGPPGVSRHMQPRFWGQAWGAGQSAEPSIRSLTGVVSLAGL